jgi:hypothetical protein
MKEQLLSEKAEIEKKISHNEKLIEATNEQNYLLRKKSKIIDKFIKQLDDVDTVPVGVINNAVPYTVPKENALSKDQPEER